MEGLITETLKILGWILALVLILIGLAGTVLPALPGVPILLLGLLLIAWIDGFINVSLNTMLWLGVLALLSVVVDFLATAEGARRFGAGRLAILGASLGLLIGLFFGLPGIVFGPFLGAVAGHLLGKASLDQSVRAGVGASIGVMIGTVSKVLIACLMLVWFVLAWLL
ncbi:MAG: DUF456 domain-containing protein [Wenzhouxiangella sp.]